MAGPAGHDGAAARPYSYEQTMAIADFILARTARRPRVAIICGSGLSGLGDLLTDACTIDYADIPGFPESTGARWRRWDDGGRGRGRGRVGWT